MTDLQDKLAAMRNEATSGNAADKQQVPDPVLKQDHDSQESVDLPTDPVEMATMSTDEPTPFEPVVPKTPTPVQVITEKIYHVFYNTMNSVKMITEAGRTIAFVGGKYVTDVQEEIDYLQQEISLGNMYLSTKPGQERMTARDLDPMTAIRKQHMLEFKALQAEAARKIAAGEPLSQSESEVTPLTPGSTAHIAQLADGQ